MRKITMLLFVLLYNANAYDIRAYCAQGYVYGAVCTNLYNNSYDKVNVYAVGSPIGTTVKGTTVKNFCATGLHPSLVTTSYNTTLSFYTYNWGGQEVSSDLLYSYSCVNDIPCPAGTIGVSQPNCFCPTTNSSSVNSPVTCNNGSTSNSISCASGKVTVQHVNANNSSGIYIKSGGSTYYCGIDGSACPDALLSGATTGFSICNSTNLPSCTYSAGDAGKEFKTKLSCVDVVSSSSNQSSSSGGSSSSASPTDVNVIQGPRGNDVSGTTSGTGGSDKDYTGLLQAQLKELDSIKWDQRYGNQQNDQSNSLLREIRDKEDSPDTEKDYSGPLGIITNFLSKILNKLDGDLVNLDSINGNLNLEAGNIDTLESFPEDYDTSAIVDTSVYGIDTSFSALPKFDSSAAVSMVDRMADSAENRLTNIYSKVDVLPTTTCVCTDISPTANLPLLGKISIDDYICSTKYIGLDFFGVLSAFLKILVVFICIRLALETF